MNESSIGGLPSRVFAPSGFNDLVTSRSGRRLYCRVSAGELAITDSVSKYHFYSYIDGDNDNQINFDIRTDHPTKMGPFTRHRRHPDLYAAQLMRASLRLFKDQGYNVTKLKAKWAPQGSVNYDEYVSYLHRHSRRGHSTLEQRIEAARHTWTGQRAQELGFSRITTDVDSSGYYTIVIFER